MGPKESGDFRDNPLWKIFNDPKFTEKCRQRDPALLDQLRLLSAMDKEALGVRGHQALANTTDQRVGKFFRALGAAMAEPAIGDVLHVALLHCRMPEQNDET